MTCKIVIHDEVNASIYGLREAHLTQLIEATKLRVKGYQHNPMFKIGAWDGKEAFIDQDGLTTIYTLDKVLEAIELFGYDIELVDNRKTVEHKSSLINDSIFEEHGITLRYYQVDAVNEAIRKKQGILNVATSGGKTLITAAIAKAFVPYRSLVIVPSENLVDQTYKELQSVGIDCGRVYAKIAPKKRAEQWGKDVVIVTWQTLNHDRTKLHEFDIFLFDECHNVGDVMFSVMIDDLSHAHVRIGLTGTPPKDKHKLEKLQSHLGGDIIYTIEPKQLMVEGHISKVNIAMQPISHDIVLEDTEWDDEFEYLLTNETRMDEIINVINSYPKTNTLILTHAKFGKQLAERMGLDFIDKDVKPAIREEYFRSYSQRTDYNMVATWGTVGTGISINDIYRMFMIDVGKDSVKIVQGIGRACRLDSLGINEVDIVDIYSTMYYSDRHKKERVKEYKKKKYPFKELPTIQIQ